jgi:hypothetical protein
MRWLTAVVLIVSALWGGYWFVGARALDGAARDWLAAQTSAGRSLTYDTLEVQGFPNRFDLTVEGPRLENRDAGFGWTAPFLQILSLSYKPWHVIAAFPPTQTLTLPGASLTLEAQKLQASLVMRPESRLPLERTVLIGADLRLSGDLSLTMTELRLAARARPEAPDSYEIGLAVSDASSPILAQATPLPERVQSVTVNAIAHLSAPLDRVAIQSPLHLLRLEISGAEVLWGEVSLFVTGDLRADATGQAEGSLSLRLQNWKTALTAAQSLGALSADQAASWARAATFLAGQSEDPSQITLPLTMTQGQMFLGPLPLGPAPFLR